MTAIPVQATPTHNLVVEAPVIPAPRVPADDHRPTAAPSRSMRGVKDHNGIYHSNAGRPVMWVMFWICVVAWIVLIGGIAAAAAMS